MARKYDADETNAELIKLNAFLEQQVQQEREERERAKAERRREEAAASLKKVHGDPGATPEEKAEAEAAWKETVATETQAGAPGAT